MSSSSRRAPGAGSATRRQQARDRARLAAAAARRRRVLVQVGVVTAVAVLVLVIVATAVVVGRRSAPDAAAGAPVVDTTVTVGGARVPLAVDGSAVRLGRADAPAQVDLWVDYSCPHCQEYEAANAAVLDQLVAGGDVAVRYHNIQIVTGYGSAAGSAAACVAAEDPQRWPAVNAALYAQHSATTDGWSADQFRRFAASRGVTGTALDCIGEARYTGWITANTADAAARGVRSTPTLQLNGQTVPTLGGQQLLDRVGELARG
ncbi:Protein-disulfide isomerase [Friedmanniella luteola]|uniref:Protein-disulfide isomerase n=1 Tax=Friedmanniella luteola TaxID=546871 RepID=A0A1H1XIA4_9ACTN|nr:thioredoxin domain-containing protein [Friedmanniella luteola]SDT08920.1 Protein-disulfide isomerase [Friedmanniella luteola]